MKAWTRKNLHQLLIHRANRNILKYQKRYCTASLLCDDIEEIDEEDLCKIKDISESVSSSTKGLKVTSNDYYTQYSHSFFTDSHQKMVKSIENADEFNPQCSLSKAFEETSLIAIEPGVIKTSSSILKVELKVKSEHLGEKKRIRLDEYLFRRLIFAVFHYTNYDKDKNNDLMDPIQLRFRIFDKKAKKRARQTLRKYRAEQNEQRTMEKESISSPLTLTQMKLSRSMINRYTTEFGAIINDLIHIYRPSYKLKLHDQVICYISYSFLLEQYHKRIAQLFMHSLRQSKQAINSCNDEENEEDNEEDEENEEDAKEEEETKENIESDTKLKVYDIEREISRIDAQLMDDNDNIDSENDQDNNNYEENEHKMELERLRSITVRSVTNQHVLEWLQLIGKQIIPSETLITKNKIYTKHDIVLYEDDDIMVINKPPNISVHPTFSTGCDFSNSLVNFLLFHCPKLRDIQYNAIRSFTDSSFDDLLSQCNNIEDEDDINIFYNHIQNRNIKGLDIFRETERETFINSPLEDIMKPGIVHRIDKGTSGLLVIGKDGVSCRFLGEQFSSHSIDREYLALAHNKLPKELWTEENYIERHPIHRTQFHVMAQSQRSPFSLLTQDEVKEENIIRRKLGRMSYEEEEAIKKERMKMNQLKSVEINTQKLEEFQKETKRREREINVNEFELRQKRIGSAKLALTHFRELETFEYIPNKQRKRHLFSLLNCKLGSGRTHQVRVHCNHLKIPIIGDNIYFIKQYKKYENELFDEITDFNEMHYLHAYLLKFKHINGRTAQFTANPPEMFTKVLGRLRTLPIIAQ